MDFFAAGAHRPLLEKVAALRAAGKTIYPPQDQLLYAFACTAWDRVRVLIVGQDPYHGQGQAHGLAFSVREGQRVPPSLRNILKEVARDPGLSASALLPSQSPSSLFPPSLPSPSPELTRWARQGVLLLNTVLSVEAGKAHSHAALGWQSLTCAVVEALAARPQPLAVLLWGNAAKEFLPLFTPFGHKDSPHLVLCAAHPSPLSASRGFHGCGHFSAVNSWLAAQNEPEIVW